MWHYYRQNPEFITLLNSENLLLGANIAKSQKPGEYSTPALDVLVRVLKCGVEQNLFRADVAARDVYLMIAAMGYFYQSNRFTLSNFLGEDLQTEKALAHWEAFIVDAVVRCVSATAPAARVP